MRVGINDLFWNFSSVVAKIGVNLLILPIILANFTSEYVTIWNFFALVNSVVILFDFGFSPIFTQNLTYVFSGVQNIKEKGIENGQVSDQMGPINYSLINGLVGTMKYLYKRIALFFFLFLCTLGTLYLYNVIDDYNINKFEVFGSWAIVVLTNTIFLFSFYYEPILLSLGKIGIAKKISVISQFVYLILSILVLYLFKSFIAVVLSQLISVIILRFLYYKAIFSIRFKEEMIDGNQKSNEILSKIIPNATRLGLTSLGGFLVQRSPILIGGLYLNSHELASYGISNQITMLTLVLSTLYINTHLPFISRLRTKVDRLSIIKICRKSLFFLIAVYFFIFSFIYFFGNMILERIGSDTRFLESNFLILAFIISFIEAILSAAASVIQTKNEVPFFKASIVSGICIVIGIYFSLSFWDLGLIALLIIPLIVDLSYQAWKWPLELTRDLREDKLY